MRAVDIPAQKRTAPSQARIPSHRRHIPCLLSALLDGRGAPRRRHQLDASSVNRKPNRRTALPGPTRPLGKHAPASRTRPSLPDASSPHARLHALPPRVYAIATTS
ncbi:hypothetical protein MSAN_00915200 [Mycena sanguinolenta]|uniref:Uncharacterized protein n=1 Tax=Mycena sanguinolenta TaxID=230812 RepID=A0A8H6YX71_9AGAR|nr:hypothetical protein MSAN_00915200 [Mycena sanguinolenta]